MTDRLLMAALALAILGTSVVDWALPFPDAQSGGPNYLRGAVLDTGQQDAAGVPAPEDIALLASPGVHPLWTGTTAQDSSVAGEVDTSSAISLTLAEPLPPAVESVVRDYRKPEPISDRSGYLRRMAVRLTYYVDVGRMRTGYQTFWGAASVDPRVIPHGTVFRIVGDDVLRVALDTGGLVKGAHADIWMPSDQAGKRFIREHGDYAEIEIIQEAR